MIKVMEIHCIWYTFCPKGSEDFEIINDKFFKLTLGLSIGIAIFCLKISTHPAFVSMYTNVGPKHLSCYGIITKS